MFVAMAKASGRLVALKDHEQARHLNGQAFVCPACREAVRIKNGHQMPAHFAHVNAACSVSTEAESLTHLNGKLWLQQFGRRRDFHTELETYYPQIRQRADVVFTGKGLHLVLEFQCSPLEATRLLERTKGYRQLQLTPIWILGPTYDASKKKGVTDKQLKFLQYRAGGYELWYCDSQHYLERWLFQESSLLVTRYTKTQKMQIPRNFVISTRSAAQAIQNGLHYRDPHLMALQQAAYLQGKYLGGVPWLVHQHLSLFHVFALPEWQMRAWWLLTFARRTIEKHEEAAFWENYLTPLKSPLIDQHKLITQLAETWRKLLLDQGYLVITENGWRWKHQLEWFPDLERKLQAL